MKYYSNCVMNNSHISIVVSCNFKWCCYKTKTTVGQ